MLRIFHVVILVGAFALPARAQGGLTYRYRSEQGTGQVWMMGGNARREFDAKGSGPLGGLAEVWTNDGRERLMIDPARRTFYDLIAYRKKANVNGATMQILSVGRPFRVDGAEAVKIDVTPRRRPEQVGDYTCYRWVIDFSYTLKLSAEGSPGSFPARVEGVEDICLMDTIDAPPLPFGHGVALTSTHADVDKVLNARLSELKGIPVARMVKVTRRIEGGEQTTASSATLLSDIRQVSVPLDRFHVAAGYRELEPPLSAPLGK